MKKRMITFLVIILFLIFIILLYIADWIVSFFIDNTIRKRIKKPDII